MEKRSSVCVYVHVGLAVYDLPVERRLVSYIYTTRKQQSFIYERALNLSAPLYRSYIYSSYIYSIMCINNHQLPYIHIMCRGRLTGLSHPMRGTYGDLGATCDGHS